MAVYLLLPFIISAIILSGLAFTALGLFKMMPAEGRGSLYQQRYFWVIAIISGAFAFTFFSLGVVLPYDAFDTNIFLYFGNLMLVTASIFQVLFCLSLTQSLNRNWKYGMFSMWLIYAIIFNHYRMTGDFVERTVVTGVAMSITFMIQAFQLMRYRKQDHSILLRYLAIINMAEFIVATVRVVSIVKL